MKVLFVITLSYYFLFFINITLHGKFSNETNLKWPSVCLIYEFDLSVLFDNRSLSSHREMIEWLCYHLLHSILRSSLQNDQIPFHSTINTRFSALFKNKLKDFLAYMILKAVSYEFEGCPILQIALSYWSDISISITYLTYSYQ